LAESVATFRGEGHRGKLRGEPSGLLSLIRALFPFIARGSGGRGGRQDHLHRKDILTPFIAIIGKEGDDWFVL
jgi:hypothetical protein